MDTSPIPRTLPRAPNRARAAAALLLVVALGAGVVACSGSTGESGAVTTTTSLDLRTATTPDTAVVETLPMPPDFVVPDSRNVVLAPVESDERDQPRRGENVLPVRGGTSTVRVRVEGPFDRGERLVVRFERHAHGLVGWTDVPTGSDGVAVLAEAVGGRYRVRAWRSPDLAATESQLAFVGQDATVELRVRVERFEDIVLSGALRSASWRVGDVVPLDVLAVRESVDRDGRVRGAPQAVEVVASPRHGVAIEEEAVLTTDPGSGGGTVLVRCLAPGQHQVVLSAEGDQVDLTLPECGAPVATTTSTSRASEDDTTSSTTRPRPTSTTRPRPTTTRPEPAG